MMHSEKTEAALTALTAEYAAYCDANKLQQISADELLHELAAQRGDLDRHIKWLSDFMLRWEAADC